MDEKEARAKSYMKYSGMAFELVALMVVAVFLGKQLDKWLDMSKPYGTAGVLVLFLVAYFVKLTYTLGKK